LNLLRQGKPGKFFKVYCPSDLDTLGISETEIKNICDTQKGFDLIDQKRIDKYQLKYNICLNNIAEANIFHKNSKKLLEDIMNKNLKGIQNYFGEYKGSFISKNTIKISKTLCLMDATCSMGSTLNICKDTVISMFQKLKTIIEETKSKNNLNISIDCFQLQFAFYRNYNSPINEILECS
jgi:hypothetical protein